MVLVASAVDGRVKAGLAGRLPDLYEALVRALVFAFLIAAAFFVAGRVLDHRRVSDSVFTFSRPSSDGLRHQRLWAEHLARGDGDLAANHLALIKRGGVSWAGVHGLLN